MATAAPHRSHGPTRRAGHLPFTRRARTCLERSLHEVQAQHSDYLGTEHIALALLATDAGVPPVILSSLEVSMPREILRRYRQAS
jgi:ATP-dependent Clp protease ATP-binding subunit ClpA